MRRRFLLHPLPVSRARLTPVQRTDGAEEPTNPASSGDASIWNHARRSATHAHKRPQSLHRLRDALYINWPEPEPLRSRGLSGGAVPCWYVARTKYVLHVSYSWYGQLHCTRKGLRASLRSAAVTSRAYKKAQKQCVFCSQTKTLLKGVRLS